MKPLFLRILVLASWVSLFSCGGGAGGTEAGNFRTVKGELVSGAGASLQLANQQVSDCVADRVMATNSLSEEMEGEVAADCSFTFDLEVGRSYRIHLEKDAALVATMSFDHNASYLSSSVMILSQSEVDMDFGEVRVAQDTATPENQPAEQNDQDGDGINDFDDTDDDGDAVEDEEEGDCDDDGTPDDYDLNSTCIET